MPLKFTQLDNKQTDTIESFFSNSFLSARIDSNQESNKGYDPILEVERDEEWRENHWKEVKENELKYEEDVNQYITLTLSDLVEPKYQQLFVKYLVGINSDAGQSAIGLEQNAEKYYLFRVNADFLLLNLGLFNPDSNILGTAYFDKGEYYYYSAACSLKEIKNGRSGLSDVLEKLSNRFGKYVEILRHMKNSGDNNLSFHYKIPQSEMENLGSAVAFEVEQKRKSSDQ